MIFKAEQFSVISFQLTLTHLLRLQNTCRQCLVHHQAVPISYIKQPRRDAAAAKSCHFLNRNSSPQIHQHVSTKCTTWEKIILLNPLPHHCFIALLWCQPQPPTSPPQGHSCLPAVPVKAPTQPCGFTALQKANLDSESLAPVNILLLKYPLPSQQCFTSAFNQSFKTQLLPIYREMPTPEHTNI